MDCIECLRTLIFPTKTQMRTSPQQKTIGVSSHLFHLAEGEGFEPPWACALTVFKFLTPCGTQWNQTENNSPVRHLKPLKNQGFSLRNLSILCPIRLCRNSRFWVNFWTFGKHHANIEVSVINTISNSTPCQWAKFLTFQCSGQIFEKPKTAMFAHHVCPNSN